MGAGHCLSMCGGVVAALSFSQGDKAGHKPWLINLFYSLGRIGTYGVLGGLAAAFAGTAPDNGWPIIRTFSGLLMVLLGLHFLGKTHSVLWLERLGQGVWRWLRPLATALLPVNNPVEAMLAGAVWGWLPCGLVYSALVYASAQGAFVPGALVMLAFGVGTLPALLFGGVVALKLKDWFSRRKVRAAVALGYILFGLWAVFFAWYHVFVHQHPILDQAESAKHQHHK